METVPKLCLILESSKLQGNNPPVDFPTGFSGRTSAFVLNTWFRAFFSSEVVLEVLRIDNLIETNNAGFGYLNFNSVNALQSEESSSEKLLRTYSYLPPYENPEQYFIPYLLFLIFLAGLCRLDISKTYCSFLFSIRTYVRVC